jgi:ubiquinone/menaquinone biosynthesis C-methylase UbiE
MTKLAQLQRDWDDLATIDHMWAICSENDKQHEKWDLEEFFETGKLHIRKVLESVNGSDIPLNRGMALDFGCGIGRLTQALAQEFDIVYGVDIAPTMIERAKQVNRFGERCRYVLNAQDDLQVFDDNSFDFIYTYIVLQHMPPDLMLRYLQEFIRILRPKGVLIFQVPLQRLEQDEKKNYLSSLPKYHPARVTNKLKGVMVGHDITDRYYKLRRLGFSKIWLYKAFGLRPEIQMHTLSEDVITKFILAQGATIVHMIIKEDITAKMSDGQFTVVKPA